MRLLWNALGTAVLAETASDTDATNQSYYGETKLHFLVRTEQEFLASQIRLQIILPVPSIW